MGTMFAKVIKKVAIDEALWNILMPISVKRTANIVTNSLNIPVGALEFDTNVVATRLNQGFDFM